MNEIMNEVPDIITGKDLNYLSDVFNWHYTLVKKINCYMEMIKDEEIRQSVMRVYNDSLENLHQILNILNEKGNDYE